MHDLGDDPDADAPDLHVLAGRILLLHERRRHAEGERLVVAQDHDVERLAATLLDGLHELVGREHGLARDREHSVAGAETGPLGGQARVDRADLGGELRSRAEVPDLVLLLEDRVTRGDAPRDDLDLARSATPRDRQPEGAPLRGRQRAVEVFPVRDGASVEL